MKIAQQDRILLVVWLTIPRYSFRPIQATCTTSSYEHDPKFKVVPEVGLKKGQY